MPDLKALTLADIMSRNVRALSAQHTLVQAAQIMAEAKISCLLIEAEGLPVGLLTETDILNALHRATPGDTPAIKSTSHLPLTAAAETGLLAARSLLAKHDCRHLIVVDKTGKACGLVSESDFRLHLGTEFFRNLRSLENVMEREIPHLEPDAPLSEAIARMVKTHSDYIIISRQGFPLGILTERDVPRLLLNMQTSGQITAGQAMSSPLRGIKVSESVVYALDLMTEHHLRHMAVLNGENKVIGIVSQHRLFEQLANSQIEENLRRTSEERDRLRLRIHLQMALDAAGAGNWEYDHTTDRHILSHGLQKMLNCTPASAPHKQADWIARVHPDDLAPMAAAVNTIPNHETDRHVVEYRVRRDDGEWIWVEDRSQVIERHPDGRPKVSAGILTDITQRRLERNQLEEERSRLRTLLQTLPDMVWLKAPNGVYLDINAQAARLFGLPPEAIIGQTDHDLMPAAVADQLRADDQIAVNSQKTHIVEEWLTFPDGHQELHKTTKNPVYAPNGKLIGVMGIAHEITLYRKNSQALHRQNRSLRLLSGIAHALNRHHDEVSMLTEICLLAVELGEFALAWIGEAVHDEAKTVSPVAISGLATDYPMLNNISWANTPHGQGPTGRAIREGLPTICRDIKNDSQYDIWRAAAILHGFQSSIALPLRVDGKIVGAINLYSSTVDAFDEEEISFLEDLAGEIGFGISIQRSRLALAESEASLLQAQRVAQLGHFNFDPMADCWTCSPILDEIFGIDATHPKTAQSWLGLIHQDDRQRMQNYLAEEVIGQCLDFDNEYRIVRHKTGETRWVHGTGEIKLNAQGQVKQLFGTIQDITEQRNAAEQLRKLSLAIEQSPHSVVITNTSAEIEYVNEAFVINTGYSRQEAIGQNPKILHSGQTPQSTYQAMWKSISCGEVWRGEFINKRKDGSIYIEFSIMSPVRQPDGKITHYLAIKEDITEKKYNAEELDRHRHHLETLISERTEELTIAKNQAEAASRAKSSFVANMSHEIRTPMNAIIGLTHIAQRETSNPEQRERLAKVASAAQHLLSIINDVLDISKIEAGKLHLETTEFYLSNVLETVRSLIHERADAKSLPVTCHIAADLPKVLCGDPLRIQQILLNFLSNAVKFTEYGEITLAARLLHENSDGMLVRFEVKDTGIGMPPEVQSRLFIPFEQADSSTTRRYGGTGLGLAISHRLAEAMNGAIGASSQVGQGSIFWFTARLQALPANRQPATLPHSTGSNELQMAAFNTSTRLLLAEDNPVNQEVAVELLRGAGLLVDIASDGQQAIDMFCHQTYDLILMDMQMPLIDGLEATRQIRARPDGKNIPILAMTANAFAEDRDLCLAAGMNDHIAKPVDPNILFATLSRWLPLSSTPPVNLSRMTNPDPTSKDTVATDSANSDHDLQLALDAVPGLDLQFGMKAVRGRLSSYKRLLGKFAESHGEDFKLIEQRLQEKALDEARRLAHSLKGASGSLGAVAVQNAAAALEIAIRDQHAPEEIAQLLSQTAEIYNKLQTELASILQEEAPTVANPASLEQLVPLVRQLFELLNASEMNVQPLVRSQQAILATLFGERLIAFDNLVAAFDFDGALSLLEASCIAFPGLNDRLANLPSDKKD